VIASGDGFPQAAVVTFAWIKPFATRRFAGAVVAGLCLAAAFPKPALAGLAWIAPALLLLSAWGRGGGEAFRLGYVGGLACNLAAYYWLLLIPVTGPPTIGWIALSMYLALYPAVWVWLLAPSRDAASAGAVGGSRWSRMTELLHTGPPTWPWSRRTLWAAYGAALWVALEAFRGWFLSGLPWDPLGASQFRLLPLIQITSVTGVAGLSFLIVWTSLSVLLAGLAILRAPGIRSAWVGEIILPFTVVAAVFAFGNHRLAQTYHPGALLKVACIQPSIPQAMIWDSRESSNRFTQLLALSRRALAKKPDLLIWPEAALPSFDPQSFAAITNLISEHRVWMIFGADDAERVGGSVDKPEYKYFNSAFLFGPDTRYVASYRKRKLVAFGEYVPLSRWLPFLKYFTPIEGGFTPGPGPVSFTITDPLVRLCPLICFEDIFPRLVRRSLADDTDLLVNLANNGWFGESAAQWQHAATAIFRAVENGVPLLRCANNGLTCLVDRRGCIAEAITDERDTIYGPGFMVSNIRLVTSDDTPRTFYRQHGEWFAGVCVVVALIGIARKMRRLKAR
jgi:apolipoprotein N-acyltransferase